MGFTIWDRVEGGPARDKRYDTRQKASKACEAMNAKDGGNSRYYVKPL